MVIPFPAVLHGFWATCLVSTYGFQILGNVTHGPATRTPEGQGQEKELAGWSSGASRRPIVREKRMDGGMKKWCPPGTSLPSVYCHAVGPQCPCVACQDGSFTQMENLLSFCRPCQMCDSERGQVVLQRCTPVRNTQCGCRRGQFRDNLVDKYFYCQKCTDCEAENRSINENCSEWKNAVCGDCLPGFCRVGSSCLPCPGTTRRPLTLRPTTSATSPATTPFIEKSPTEACGRDCKFAFGVLLVLLFLLLLATLMFCHRRRRRATSCSPTAPSVCTVPANFSLSQPGSEDTTRQGFAHSVHHPLLHAGLPPPHVENALGAGRKPPHHTAVGEPLHGRNLYVIIDAVPVRRWKEFVRGLGLRDGEIELVELEHTLFREQQYEMLKRWSHQQGASLATVLAVLEDMQLGGCAQQLSEQLQAGTVWGGLRGGGRELGCSARPPPWEGC